MSLGTRGAPTPTLRVNYLDELCADPLAEVVLLLALPLASCVGLLFRVMVRGRAMSELLPLLERAAALVLLPRVRRRGACWSTLLAIRHPTPRRCPGSSAVGSTESRLLVAALGGPLSLRRSPPALTARRMGLGSSTWSIRCMRQAGAHRDQPLRLRSVALPPIAMGTCLLRGAPTGPSAATAERPLSALGKPSDDAGADVLRSSTGTPSPPAEGS